MNGRIIVAMVAALLIAGTLVLLSRFVEPAPAAAEAKPSMGLGEAMASEDPATRAKAQELAPNERSRIIWALIETLRSVNQASWERTTAIRLLGKYRAVEAAPVLIENLDCPPVMVSGEGFGPFQHYPAARALVEIGEPAVQHILLNTLGRPVSDRHLKVYAYVIWQHHSPMDEQEVGLFRLQRLLAEEKRKVKQSHERYGGSGPSEREKNLTRLIEIYRKIQEGDRSDFPPRPERRPGSGSGDAANGTKAPPPPEPPRP